MFSDSLKGAPVYYIAACLLIDIKSLSIAVSLVGLLQASTLYAYNLCLYKCNLLHQFISHCRERLQNLVVNIQPLLAGAKGWSQMSNFHQGRNCIDCWSDA